PGLVNAVLRAISRRRDSLPLPPRPVDPTDRPQALEYLTIALSHPRWLAERWHDRVGFEDAERWMIFNNTQAPLTLRANRLVCTRDQLAGRLLEHQVVTAPTRFAPDGLIVASGHPLREPGTESGSSVA